MSGSSLPKSSSDLSVENREVLFIDFKNKLKDLVEEYATVYSKLSPNVRKRVDVLREIQSQYDELEAKFFEERSALEANYQKLYEPLYIKRYEIVNGIVEVDGVNEKAMDQGEDKAEEDKGVPNFWLTAMKTNDVLAEEISERDEGALKYLKDIKWCKIDNPKGFKLEFYFETNPYFKNSVLTKEYHMIDENESILEKSIGTEIEWYPEKHLTQKILEKKAQKGSKNAEPITKTESVKSFFNFFYPPPVPEVKDILDQDSVANLENVMEQDFNIGSIIRDKIIPHAVSWFMGEAVGDDLEDTDDNDTDDDSSEDIEITEQDYKDFYGSDYEIGKEEDDDEDDDDEDETKTEGKTGEALVGGQQGEQPQECK